MFTVFVLCSLSASSNAFFINNFITYVFHENIPLSVHSGHGRFIFIFGCLLLIIVFIYNLIRWLHGCISASFALLKLITIVYSSQIRLLLSVSSSRFIIDFKIHLQINIDNFLVKWISFMIGKHSFINDILLCMRLNMCFIFKFWCHNFPLGTSSLLFYRFPLVFTYEFDAITNIKSTIHLDCMFLQVINTIIRSTPSVLGTLCNNWSIN